MDRQTKFRKLKEALAENVRFHNRTVPFASKLLASVVLWEHNQSFLEDDWQRLINEHAANLDQMPMDDRKFYDMAAEYLKDERPRNPSIKHHRFVLEGSRWYIDLPEFIFLGGDKAELEMVAGADTMLFHMAEGRDYVDLQFHTLPFKGADQLTLTKTCEPEIGGGYYFIKTFEGQILNQEMWLCKVTEFVFGYLPEDIFIKKVKKPVILNS